MFQLSMMPPSGTALLPNSTDGITQSFRISSPEKQPIRVRMRLQFKANGADLTEQADVSNFPTVLWQ
jgi:AP-1 complex subunit gamma-1